MERSITQLYDALSSENYIYIKASVADCWNDTTKYSKFEKGIFITEQQLKKLMNGYKVRTNILIKIDSIENMDVVIGINKYESIFDIPIVEKDINIITQYK